MFERYTEKARRVIFFARYEASNFGSPYIETEHLLLGLLREDKALTNRFLRSHASVESIRKQVEGHTTIRAAVSTSVDLPLTNEGKRVLAYAAEEAERLADKHIGTEHLLLGLLREEKCFAAEILHERGLLLSTIREELDRTPHKETVGSTLVNRQVSLDEYLRTDYEPDCDYINGELEKRSVGERDHSAVLAFFAKSFAVHEEQWKLEAHPAIRMRISSTRIRVADLAILPINSAYQGVLAIPPLAVVEVVSPEDRVSRYQARLDDYRAMGISNIWVVDPMRRKAFDCSQGGWQPVDSFESTKPPLTIALGPLWAKLDQLHA